MIVIKRQTKNEILEPSQFKDEHELESIICNHPQLLTRDDDQELFFVKRQLNIDSGIVDVVMLTADGLPAIVEVKLAKNPETRRKIVGQLIDYVATITTYTVDEFNDLLDGALENVLSEICIDDAEFRRKRQLIGSYLRAGVVRYILVVDTVNQDLERIVKFLALRSNLDIRLVSVEKYISENGETIFVPKNIIAESESSSELSDPSSDKTVNSALISVVEAYNAIPNVIPIVGSARHYRQIKIDGWPKGVHYEFIRRSGTVAAEIHLESNEVAHLGSIIQSWEKTPPNGFKNQLRWDQKWSKGRGRLSCILPDSADSMAIAEAMAALINSTKNVISHEIKKKLLTRQ